MIIGEGEILEVKEHGKKATFIGLYDDHSDSCCETIIYSSQQMQEIIDILLVHRDRMAEEESNGST